MTMIYETPMRLLIILCFLFLFASCGAPVRQQAPEEQVTQEQQAIGLMSAGNYITAAEEYLRLAEQNKRYAETYILKAGDAYIKAIKPELAESVLGNLQQDKLTTLQITELNILFADIAILNNDALTALNKLNITIPADSPLTLLAEYYQTKATALEMDGQLMPAVHTRFELNNFLLSEQELADNNQAIWQLLSQSDANTLLQELGASTGKPSQASWLELAIISKTLLYKPQELENAIQSWKQQYPDHSAALDIINEIYAAAEQANEQPGKIALLLPFSVQYKDVSNAIRDGFLAAWYESSASKPVIKIYNADNTNIIDVYQAAVNDGADFVVGPLEKESVAMLISSDRILVRTLALNQIDNPDSTLPASPGYHPSPQLFQFGLLPEDDARVAAERAWFDGHANALIITPDSNWGDRIFNAFSTRWIELGGRVIEHVRLPMDVQDYSKPVKQLLNIDNSEQRAKQLTAALRRNIEFEPRYRRDADVIFLASSSIMAKQLVPQLRFFRADSIPTYSISSIYTGKYDPEADSDINNIIFSDMPWVIDPAREYSPLQQTLNKTWGQSESPYRRLYAFGIDAYRILPELGRLYTESGSFQGESGILKLTEQGQVIRQSVWAKFLNGTPQLLDAGQTP
jgi:outer membrane PBP1 activator LpoA protein